MPLTQFDRTAFIDLYMRYLKTSSLELRFFDQQLSNLNKYFDTIRLEITNDLYTIQSIYEKTGCLLLRKLDPTKKILIIGCGENSDNSVEDPSTGYTIFPKYEYHAHYDAITIDADLLPNPTIVAEFGRVSMMQLFNMPEAYSTPCKIPMQFDYIFCEGVVMINTIYDPPPINTPTLTPWGLLKMHPYALHDLRCLLSDHGIFDNDAMNVDESFDENGHYTKIPVYNKTDLFNGSLWGEFESAATIRQSNTPLSVDKFITARKEAAGRLPNSMSHPQRNSSSTEKFIAERNRVAGRSSPKK